MTSTPAPLQQAKWLWPDLGFHNIHNCFARFRKIITLATVPRTAKAWVTADQYYHLRVNGKLVCRGPARGYQENWAYDEVDLAPFLRKGRNLITIRAYNPGHSSFAYRTEGFAGILFAARIGKQSIVSDNSWKCIREAGTRRDTWPYSLQLSTHQEGIDLRIEDPAWETLGFDDSNWKVSEELRLWNAPPYFNLIPRGIPNLSEFKLKPKCIGKGGGRSLTAWRETDNFAGHRASEALGHRKADDNSPSLHITATAKGRFQSYLFDFGKVVVGSPKLRIKGARGGETIDLLHTEAIESARLAPRVDLDDHSRVRLGNRLICRKGAQSHCFLQHLGFRYLTLTIRENPGPLDIEIELEACGYPLDGPGSFSCDDSELTRIWQACAHTQRICSLDAYVDTPWREQAQWWGDARIQAWNTFHLCNDSRLLRRGIGNIAQQSNADGIIFGHAPTIAHNCILPDFSLIWILTLWDDYWQTGETTMLEQHSERIRTILAYFRRQTDSDTGLIHHDPRYWLFLDWTDIQKEGQPALLSLWLLYTLQQLKTLLRATDALPNDFEEVPAWAASLEASVRKHLLDKDGLVRDGLSTRGKPSKMKSLQSQTLAWLCELAGFDQQKALEKIFLPWLREDRISHAPPSSYWCAYPLDLLAREGYGKEGGGFIRRHWKAMADFGSCFENFDVTPAGGDILSHSHAWSAHPLYILMRTLGGIRQTAPAWASVSINPVFVGERADVCIPTPKGTIEVRWQRKGESEPVLQKHVPSSISLTNP